MNLFRVDFVQGNSDAPDYGTVVHQLEDFSGNRQIIDLTLSPDKLASVSNYQREPRRLTLEYVVDSWTEDYLLSGSYEHDRYISHYEVKVYRDGVIFFSGIIDTSNLSYDPTLGTISILCYDKLKLLSLFTELTHYYSITAGYSPQWIIHYFIQDIMQTIPVNIPLASSFTLPAYNLTGLELVSVETADLLDLSPPSGYTYSYHASSWETPKFGYLYNTFTNEITFVHAHQLVIDAEITGSHYYQGRYRGRVVRILNGICTHTESYDQLTPFTEEGELATLDANYADFISFFLDHGITETELDALAASAVILGCTYSAFYTTSVRALFAGNVFTQKLKPGQSYLTPAESFTESAKVLQAMLLLYNCTLAAAADGTIHLQPKGYWSSSVTPIDDDDVTAMKLSRADFELPDTACLDVLAGDTDLLQYVISQYLTEFFASRWRLEATLDRIDAYALALQDKVSIQGQTYGITDLTRDYKKDEYRIIAWAL